MGRDITGGRFTNRVMPDSSSEERASRRSGRGISVISRQFGRLMTALVAWGSIACQGQHTQEPPRQDYTGIVRDLEEIIQGEMQDKKLPALSIALIDDQETVWARGFGHSDPENGLPATAETIYRVGSVSKLFTDIAVMQLVEQNVLDLDRPVTDYLPDFSPRNPFGKAITLRQLMSHRSGLVREPPVGNYFDPTEPTLASMVASLNNTTLVYEPESRVKYSNAGIATVGYVLEHLQKIPFSDYVRNAVIEPLKMKNSSFAPEPDIMANLAKAKMWTYDGREFEAPTFELGMMPAGSMYSSVVDLGRFISALFGGGMAGDGARILQQATLEEMWRPQFAGPGEVFGSGIGFFISDFDGDRLIGHNGAIYGFATTLAILPEEKLGVVVVTNVDFANTVTDRIGRHALKTMLAQRRLESAPQFVRSQPVPEQWVRNLPGKFSSADGRSFSLTARNGRLYLDGSTYSTELKAVGDTLIVDDRLDFGSRIIVENENLILLGGRRYSRMVEQKPKPAPEAWLDLIGEYGWDHNTLYILEREGQLQALIEWFCLYPLRQIDEDIFAFPDYGLYHDEQIRFSRDEAGRITGVNVGSVDFPRREMGTEAGMTFRIEPIKPVDELRATALAARPPAESGEFLSPDLVDVATLDPTIKLDIRYSTTNNFMSSVFYRQARAFAQRPVAEALVRINAALQKQGYGLLIHDAYRPWYVTKMFWDATPEKFKIFVADPSHGSRHNRGCAIDLSLYAVDTGRPVQMVGGYDEFSVRSYPFYPGGTSEQRWHRALLKRAMEAEGFSVYEFEWWHFDFKDWRRYPIVNQTFEEILTSH